MLELSTTAQSGDAAAKQAEMVQFQQRMQGLRDRLNTQGDQKKELREVCQDFEAVFISQIWEQMERSVPQEGYLHSKQESMYKSMFNREFSEELAEAGGIGLADMLYEHLAGKLRLLGKENDQTAESNQDIKKERANNQATYNTAKELKKPAMPVEITPESFAPESAIMLAKKETNSAQAMQNTQGTEFDATNTVRDVSNLSHFEIEAELNRIARGLREGEKSDPGAVFDTTNTFLIPMLMDMI